MPIFGDEGSTVTTSGAATVTLVNESMAVTPPTGTLNTDTGTAGWNAGGYYVLTTNSNQHTQFYYTGNITSHFSMSVDMKMTVTNGADGIFFFWGCNTLPQTETDVGDIGYLVNRNDFGNDIELWFGGTKLANVSYTKDTNFDTLQVIQNADNIKVKYNGATVIDYTDASYPRSLPGTLYGIGSRCGGSGNGHYIKNLLVTKP